MNDWINFKTHPPETDEMITIWVLIKGRYELEHRDIVITKMLFFPHSAGWELRTLDFTGCIYQNKNDTYPLWEEIIAWMPLENMIFPDWIQNQLK